MSFGEVPIPPAGGGGADGAAYTADTNAVVESSKDAFIFGRRLAGELMNIFCVPTD